VQRTAERISDRLADHRREEDERERAEQTCARRRSSQRFRDVVDEDDGHHHSADQSCPRGDATHEAEPVADPAGCDCGRGDDEIENVHALGASNRA
jgi:hypothetical protein